MAIKLPIFRTASLFFERLLELADVLNNSVLRSDMSISYPFQTFRSSMLQLVSTPLTFSTVHDMRGHTFSHPESEIKGDLTLYIYYKYAPLWTQLVSYMSVEVIYFLVFEK